MWVRWSDLVRCVRVCLGESIKITWASDISCTTVTTISTTAPTITTVAAVVHSFMRIWWEISTIDILHFEIESSSRQDYKCITSIYCLQNISEERQRARVSYSYYKHFQHSISPSTHIYFAWTASPPQHFMSMCAIRIFGMTTQLTISWVALAMPLQCVCMCVYRFIASHFIFISEVNESHCWMLKFWVCVFDFDVNRWILQLINWRFTGKL